MSWTKLGDEFSDEARDLTDAEFRTHVEALNWSNRRLLDLMIPKRDLRRFAESRDAEAAAAGLVAKGWWSSLKAHWDIGLRFPEWQLERTVIEHRREGAALRKRRQRLHESGDHSTCISCSHVTRDGTRDPGRVGTGRDGSPRTVGSGLDSPAAARGSALSVPAGEGGQSPNGFGGPGEVPGGRDSDRTTPAPAGVQAPTPSQTRKRVPDGPEPDGPDVQQTPIEAQLQSPATDRNAREAQP
jgi:hypothetical protein